MNLNIAKSINPTSGIVGVLFVSFFLQSCRSNDNVVENDGNSTAQNVKISLLVSDLDEEGPAKSASVDGKKLFQEVQTSVIPLDGITSVIATLSPKPTANLKDQTFASVNPIAGVPNPLPNGITYKVVVYDKDNGGTYVTEKDFTTGQSDPGFALTGGKTYTFVAYSLRANSAPPTVTNGGTGSNISNAKLSAISGDLMYFKKDMTVSGNGVNNLNVILKHQFSQINTKIDARQVGIVSVNNAAITPAYTSSDLSFSTNTLTYNGQKASGEPVSFSTNNQNIVTSNTTQVIANTAPSNNGNLTIGTLYIDKIPASNFQIPNLKINPGLQYNLNLRVSPCRQDINSVPFSKKSTSSNQILGIIYTATTTSADLGYVIDFTTLDESFTLKVNGTSVSTAEIQFGNNLPSPGTPQNIQFTDGTRYGVNYTNMSAMTGAASTPLLRVYIQPDTQNPGKGKISFYGVKTANGPLFPLQLYNGNSLVSFNWNANGVNNTIELSQTVAYGSSNYIGSGVEKQTVTCAP
ncbi:hypothetical protein M2T70_18265 [Elizabethkingia anophelis]|uniref:hypothetical protein n=1 Tax=Elizabethkingia anophelis TaxID=1117645 RepID=UPI0009957BA1|nr:hypothetical protein [Elizabethkingia anophelis]AQW98995.1 hypothetical protein BBD31_14325 [Elizabethkingia anophelis]AQX89547.1 hypothetical protein AYC67_11150 [Elizabethkingia anophelis]ASV78864.1 hypothetical protein A6J37_09685 [Elizabethkingia anophelis]EHM7981392.1 hypothetical protein [Elizabethkingia anophelis]EHM8032993.1 hypothetical protein [Elizabethkingia anophelis]